MEGYTEIATQIELDKFLDHVGYFHDSMIKELQMINRGYVMKNKLMVMAHQFDTRILFQSQWDEIAFELLCIDTREISVTDPEVFFDCVGKIIVLDSRLRDPPSQLIELSFDHGFSLKCKRLFYKLCPDLYGNYEHLGSQVPSDKMLKAGYLGSNWWLCENCCEAWEVDSGRMYSTCPKCNHVARLEVQSK